MRRPGVILFAATVALFSVATAPTAHAKGKSAKAASGGAKGATPPAAELAKLKAVKLGDPKAGLYAWGMSPNEVIEKAEGAIDSRYQKRGEDARADPGKQQRIRNEAEKEKAAVRKSLTKFEGQKTGWDVSIIGPEFAQNNGEAVVQVKEDNLTRYFFFFEDRLYKMYMAFNKEVIGDKSFRDFGKEMAEKYGTPREVYHDEKQRGGVKRLLDHFEWAVNGGDALKLVDRSEFYGVYCLVVADAHTIDSVVAKRKITNPGTVERDSLVESVVNSKDSAKDTNDDIIDRLTGHEVKKPGEETRHGDIVVPMPVAPTPAEVNADSSSSKGKAATKGKAEKSSEKKSESGGGLEL